MADLRLISILTSAGVQQPQVTQGTGSQSTGIPITLPHGSIISGFIVNRDPSGNPILRTENGDIVFSSNFFLKIGSEVVLRIEQRGGSTLAHLLSVNGQPPEIAEAESAFAKIPEVILSGTISKPGETPARSNAASAPAAVALKESLPLPPALVVRGTLLAPPPRSEPGISLRAGTEFTFKIVTITSAPATVSTTAPAVPTGAQPAPVVNPGSYAAYSRNEVAPQMPSVQVPLPTAQPNVSSIIATPAPAAGALPPKTVATTAPPTTPMQPTVTIATATGTAIPTPVSPHTPAPLQPTSIPVPVTSVTTPTVATGTQHAPPIALHAATTTPQSLPVHPAIPAAASLTSAPAVGQRVEATVIAREPAGGTLIQTPVGIIRLEPGTPLPQGSTVALDITGIAKAEGQIRPGEIVAAPASMTALSRQWTSLQQIVTLLSERTDITTPGKEGAVPAGIASLPLLLAPGPQANVTPHHISAGLLFFLAALRGGDFTNWIGKANSEWLESQGHGNLLKAAQGEFITIARQFTESQPQQWQTLFFPVVIGQEWQQVRMFIKRDRKPPAGKSKGSEDARFVFEMALSQLGEMQMDGFVRRMEKEVQFDLFIRSFHPLSAQIQKDIFQIYNDMGQLTGYTGSLLFQAVKEFPVNPMEEVIKQRMNNVVA